MFELTEENRAELLALILRQYNYDFSDYASASFFRRINRFIQLKVITDFPTLINRITSEENFFIDCLNELTVNYTEMFRDPGMFCILQEQIFPHFKSYPRLKIWSAGCSSGEEVFSLSILLHENNLLEKSRIYATDISTRMIQTAQQGIYPLLKFKDYAANYLWAGGHYTLSHYYVTRNGLVQFSKFLSQNTTFSSHNLVSGQPFNTFQLIICRNVLIYFNRELQERVIKLLADSLSLNGYLIIGPKETLYFSKHRHQFELINQEYKIYQKINSI